MGFFAQHGKFSAGSGKKYSVTELQGTYICALIDCEAVQVKSFDDPNVLVPTFKWIFESTEVRDNDGQPFRLITYTKTYYGNDKAKLTILLDGMVGRMTSQQFQDLDMDVLKAKQWQVTVGIRQKMNSELFNVIQTVKPVQVAEMFRRTIRQNTDYASQLNPPEMEGFYYAFSISKKSKIFYNFIFNNIFAFVLLFDILSL